MDKKLYWISVGLVIIGLCVSVYMTIYKLTSNDKMCLGSGNCHTINSSSYSQIYGFPVAAVGVVGYLAILGMHALERRNGAFIRENGTLIVFGLALTGFLFTLYLIYLEIFVIKALCPFCVTSQVAMTFIFIVSIIRLVRQPGY